VITDINTNFINRDTFISYVKLLFLFYPWLLFLHLSLKKTFLWVSQVLLLLCSELQQLFPFFPHYNIKSPLSTLEILLFFVSFCFFIVDCHHLKPKCPGSTPLGSNPLVFAVVKDFLFIKVPNHDVFPSLL